MSVGRFTPRQSSDPDAPTRQDPKFGPWRHYVRVNVKPSDFNVSGDVITPYIGAKPPPNTGLHRYVWLAYEQSAGEIRPPTVVEFPDRRNWKLNEFVAEWKLRGPVAGNFFLVGDQNKKKNRRPEMTLTERTALLDRELLATYVS